eukprot:5468917-Pyramimonas_sp.AAC.1
MVGRIRHQISGEYPDIQRLDMFEARPPDLSTSCPGPTVHPGSFSDGPMARHWPPEDPKNQSFIFSELW